MNSLTHYWETDFNYASSPPSSPSLQAFTNATGERLLGGEGVQLGCSSKQGMPKRSPVVDQPTLDLEREIINLTSPRFDYYDRCLLEGLGGSLSRSSYQGALDPGGIITTYKCPRTQGSSLCFESFLQQSKENSCPSPNGQQNSSCLPTKNGGDTVSGSSRDSPGTIGICPAEGNFPDSRILARGYESQGRLAVKTFQGCEQLETESQSFSYIRPVMGPPNNRSLCKLHEYTTSELCELVPRPLCSGNRCLSDSLVEREGLLLFPIFTNLPLSGKDKEGPGNIGSDSTNLACTGMVPSPVGNVLQASHSTSPLRDLLLSPNQQPHPLIPQGHLQLAAWMVTGKTCLQGEFQRTLQICSAPIRGKKALQGPTTAPGNSVVAGVVNGRLIHFAPLWHL